MLRILAFLCLLFLNSCSAKSQNITATYLFYQSGSYWISFTNQKSCDADIRVNYQRGGLPKDTTFTLQASSTFILQVPVDYQSVSDLRFKSDGQCSTTGWTTVSLNTQTLPVYISKFSGQRVGRSVELSYQLTWVTSYDDDVLLERSNDGKKFVQVHRIVYGESSYIDHVDGFAYYRLRISSPVGGDKLSNVIVVPDREMQPTSFTLYTMDGKFYKVVHSRSEIKPNTPFICFDGHQYQKIMIAQN